MLAMPGGDRSTAMYKATPLNVKGTYKTTFANIEGNYKTMVPNVKMQYHASLVSDRDALESCVNAAVQPYKYKHDRQSAHSDASSGLL